MLRKAFDFALGDGTVEYRRLRHLRYMLPVRCAYKKLCDRNRSVETTTIGWLE